MKRLMLVLLLVALLVAPASAQAQGKHKNACTRIKDGVLTYSAGHHLAGQALSQGYDSFGYNYQAHMFNGLFANVYLGADGYPPYHGDTEDYLAANPGAAGLWYWPQRDLNLVMKWNDAWLSNMDCDGNGSLDRHYGFASYIGSGAWETTHMRGTYYVGDQACELKSSNTKIVAMPADATLNGGVWYAPNGTEIGVMIWSEFAIVHDVQNDPCYGLHGAQYVSPYRSGLGGW
jgi:hypothetical protein